MLGDSLRTGCYAVTKKLRRYLPAVLLLNVARCLLVRKSVCTFQVSQSPQPLSYLEDPDHVNVLSVSYHASQLSPSTTRSPAGGPTQVMLV